jgi:hypothetical protein
MRIIDFSDGFTSATSPDTIGSEAKELENFANDAAYESEYGSPSGGEIYYNSADDVIKYYDGDTSSWVEIPKDADVVKLTGNQTIAGNKTFSGDTTFNGTTTVVNATNLDVADKNITVNDGGNDASSEGAGLTIERTGTDGSLIYADASATKFKAGPSGSEVELVGTSSTQTLSNKSYSDPVTMDEVSTPSTPATGKWKLYPKTDGIYQLDDAGNETNLSSSSGVTIESAKYQGQSGYGSTNNKIPYFANTLQDSTGTVVTVANNSTSGISITANHNCYIVATYTRYPNGTSQSGFSISSSELTTGIGSITDADRAAFARHPSIEGVSVTAPVYLASGEILRPHTAGEAEADSGDRAILAFIVFGL